METILSIARHGGQLLAGYLLSKGIIDGSMTETVIGIIVSAASLGWFLWTKAKA